MFFALQCVNYMLTYWLSYWQPLKWSHNHHSYIYNFSNYIEKPCDEWIVGLFRLVHCNSRGDKPVDDGINKVIWIPQLTENLSQAFTLLWQMCPSKHPIFFHLHSETPFLGVQLLSCATWVERKVYVKPTNTGLLLHYHCHVDSNYRVCSSLHVLDHAHWLSSSWAHFSEECE